MRAFLLSAFLGLAGLGTTAMVPSPAEAHEPGRRFSLNFQYGYPRSVYARSYYGSPYRFHYYGRGGHDVYPHWHRSHTPFGVYTWYGTGPHDYRPHHHTVTPYHYRGHHYTPWGYTESYYPRYPYYYAPW